MLQSLIHLPVHPVRALGFARACAGAALAAAATQCRRQRDRRARRRELDDLMLADDYLLRDIGVSRDEVRQQCLRIHGL